MGDGKNTSSEGNSLKKYVSPQKSSEKKAQKEQLKSEVQIKPTAVTEAALSLTKKINDLLGEIESKPLKLLEKKDKEKLTQSYEKIVLRIVKEINNSRR